MPLDDGIRIKGVPKPHRGQVKVLNQAKRFNVVACGRRWGKTTFVLILIILAVADNLQRGLKQDIAFVGINKKNYSPIWNSLKALLKPFITEKSEQDTTLTILDQFKIEFWSMEALFKSEGARGRAYRLMVVDEMGSLPNFKAVWQAILYATLNDYQGTAWFVGTPKGFNDFQEFSTYHKHEYMKKYWTFYTAPSIENPHFHMEEWLMAEAQLDADYFAQEYRAEFRTLGNNLFAEEDFKNLLELPKFIWRTQIRYWDLANSEKGDFTGSIRLNVHGSSPIVVLDRPHLFRGKWSQTYPQVKAAIQAEPETVHLVETEGLGSMAWEFMLSEIATEYNGYTIYPAGREYTSKSKWDRANAWAMKAKLRHFYFVNKTQHTEAIKQISRFPYYPDDTIVDSISGGHLGVIYLYGGFGTGKNPFGDTSPNEIVQENIYLESIDLTVLEQTIQKYPEIWRKYGDYN